MVLQLLVERLPLSITEGPQCTWIKPIQINIGLLLCYYMYCAKWQHVETSRAISLAKEACLRSSSQLQITRLVGFLCTECFQKTRDEECMLSLNNSNCHRWPQVLFQKRMSEWTVGRSALPSWSVDLLSCFWRIFTQGRKSATATSLAKRRHNQTTTKIGGRPWIGLE